MGKRILITGIGAVTPVGENAASFWDANLAGRSGMRPELRMDLTGLPCGWISSVIPDEIKETIKRRWSGSNKSWGDTLMRASVMEAIEDAKLELKTDKPVGLAWARVWPGPSGSFPDDYVEFIRRTGERHSKVGSQPGDIVDYLRSIANQEPPDTADTSSFPREVSLVLERPLLTTRVDATCAGGLRAIAEAARLIELGKVDVAIVSGVVSRSNHYTHSQYAQLMALTRWKGDPKFASTPFDRRRTGMVISESAGAIVLETEEHAFRRGRGNAYAELGGWGLAVDTVHLTAPSQDMVERVIQEALARSHLKPIDIDTVNAHGTSTKLNDLVEGRALNKVFGDKMKEMYVSAVKSITGHGSAASGVIEVIVSALTVSHGMIPPVVTCTDPDPECGVLTSLTPVKQQVDAVIKNSFGFGGQYASMVLRKPSNMGRNPRFDVHLA